jgi:hypothetical protein
MHLPPKLDKKDYDRIFAVSHGGGEVRIFMSYSSIEKTVAGHVKNLLEKYGLSVFLAHDDIRSTVDWQDEIIRALKECDVFIPLLTQSFRESEWTDQETGIAYAFGEFIIPIRVGMNPYGFIGRIQACSFDTKGIIKSCLEIICTLRNDSFLGESMKDCLLRSVENSRNFDAASDIIKSTKGIWSFFKRKRE